MREQGGKGVLGGMRQIERAELQVAEEEKIVAAARIDQLADPPLARAFDGCVTLLGHEGSRGDINRHCRLKQSPAALNPAAWASACVANSRVQFWHFALRHVFAWYTRLRVLPKNGPDTSGAVSTPSAVDGGAL